MVSYHRLALHPRWRRLPVNYARNVRTAQRRYVCSHPRARHTHTHNLYIFSAPWDQKVQGCRASQEGEVKLLMMFLRLFLYCMSSTYHHHVNAYAVMNTHICTDANTARHSRRAGLSIHTLDRTTMNMPGYLGVSPLHNTQR